MLDVDTLLAKRLPQLVEKPKIFRTASHYFKKIFHQDEINQFMQQYAHLGPLEFLDQVMQMLGLSYSVDNWQLENIPAEGRVIIVANHPLGTLDGIALLKLVSQVRSDIKIVTNEILNSLDPLQDFFLPVNNLSGNSSKAQFACIEAAIQQDNAVIFFPAGEVSRYRFNGIQDCRWRTGFLRFARKYAAPILPIHVGGKNSRFFYGLSILSKPLSTLLLVKEMFRSTKMTIPMTIGKIIPQRVVQQLANSNAQTAQKFKQHLYLIGKGGAGIFETDNPVALAQDRSQLNKEIGECEILSHTPDGKIIYLLRTAKATALLSEIGRLREISFRAVGEGTGLRVDIDRFDESYEHIILWDPEELEIVGAYRVKPTADIRLEQLYSSSLFDYQPVFLQYKQQGLELGRSFVQPKYWGKKSLDYLWFGIGAYLKANQHIRYLFGAVSISADFEAEQIQWLIYYYKKYFPANKRFAYPKQAFPVIENTINQLDILMQDKTQQEAFLLLKAFLKSHGKLVPTLYKQYSELCHNGGVSFVDFNIDSQFNDCVDGLMVIDLHFLLRKKRDKYLQF